MKIRSVFMAVILLFVTTGAMATSVECLDLTPSQMISHDLHEPDFFNCYILNNEENNGLMVTLIMMDDLAGAIDIQRYNPTTKQYTALKTQSTTSGALNYHHEQNIGSDAYFLRLGRLTHPAEKKRVGVVKSVNDGVIHVAIVVSRSN